MSVSWEQLVFYSWPIYGKSKQRREIQQTELAAIIPIRGGIFLISHTKFPSNWMCHGSMQTIKTLSRLFGSLNGAFLSTENRRRTDCDEKVLENVLKFQDKIIIFVKPCLPVMIFQSKSLRKVSAIQKNRIFLQVGLKWIADKIFVFDCKRFTSNQDSTDLTWPQESTWIHSIELI